MTTLLISPIFIIWCVLGLLFGIYVCANCDKRFLQKLNIVWLILGGILTGPIFLFILAYLFFMTVVESIKYERYPWSKKIKYVLTRLFYNKNNWYNHK